MGALAVSLAVAALIASALPFPGMFVAMGLGLVAVGTGLVAWRRRSGPGGMRLAGLAGVTLGGLALIFATARYALSWAAISRMISMVS